MIGGIGPEPRSNASLAEYVARVGEARAQRRALVDLTPRQVTAREPWQLPAREASLAVAREQAGGHVDTRDALALYLRDRGSTVASDRVLVTPSPQATRDALLDALCAPGDELLVPAPAYHDLAAAAEARSLKVRRYTLRYDGAWHIERSSLRAAITPRTRVVVVASPADPTGAVLSHEELTFVEEICSTRGLVLIGDEVLADTACQPASSVIAVTRCPAFQMSGLLGLPSVPRVELTWIAAGGPERLVRPLFTRIEARAGAIAGATEPGAYAGFHAESVSLAALRARLRDNRARLASAAMREAPWTVLNSGGGCSAVLEVGLAEDEVALCISLLEEGVVLWPGKYAGFESDGFLVVSLLPDPLEFERGLEILERRLRGPLF